VEIQVKGLSWVVMKSPEILADELVRAEMLSKPDSQHFILPGGKSVLPLYNAIEQQITSFPKAFFYLTDERMVPIGNPNSNEGQIKNNFPALYKKWIGFHEANFEEKMQQMQTTEYTCIIGVGLDGHFASLFPNDGDFAENKFLHSYSLPQENYARKSLGFPFFMGAQKIILWLLGKEKGSIAHYFKQENVAMPIIRLWQSVQTQNKELTIYCNEDFYTSFHAEYHATV